MNVQEINRQSQAIVLTGASSDIGRAVAERFAKQGTVFFLLGRNKKAVERTKSLIESKGSKAKAILADFRKQKDITRAIEEIKQHTKQITTIIHIAGLWHGEDKVYAQIPFHKFNKQIIFDTYNVCLVAPTLLIHGLLPLMKTDSTIMILSGTFEDGAKGWLPYYVAKRALEDLTVGLAQELADKQITVFGISPSDVATTPYKKYFPQYAKSAMSPESLAKQIETLFSKKPAQGSIWVITEGKQAVSQFHA